MQEFYARLGLFTLDFEFTQPGCGGTSSDFMYAVCVIRRSLLFRCIGQSMLWWTVDPGAWDCRDVTFLNAMLLGLVLAPVITCMPVLAYVYGVVYRGRLSSQFFDERFWPVIERHRILSKLVPRIEQRRAQKLYLHWEARLTFSVMAWYLNSGSDDYSRCVASTPALHRFELACFIICSRAIQSIFCEYLDGEFRLASDRTLICGSTVQTWALHICG